MYTLKLEQCVFIYLSNKNKHVRVLAYDIMQSMMRDIKCLRWLENDFIFTCEKSIFYRIFICIKQLFTVSIETCSIRIKSCM